MERTGKHRYWLSLVLVAASLAPLAADESQPLAAEQRAQLLQLTRQFNAARNDSETQSAIVDKAIELGPLGIQRVLPLVEKDAGTQLTSYGKMLQAYAKRSPDANVETVIASNEPLESKRKSLLEAGTLLVRMQRASGLESESAEQLLTAAETQFVREVRLGPILSQLSDEELAAVEHTNRQRAMHNLSPLELDLKLAFTARDHSSDMVKHGFFSHTSPIQGKTTFGDRAKRFGTTSSGENIFAGSESGADAVKGWMNSEGHRANLLKPSHRRVGIGVHEETWTQLFGD